VRIDYRNRLDDGRELKVRLTVPEANWEAALQRCWDHFCAGLPPLPDVPPRVPGKPLIEGRGRRGTK